MASMEAWLAEEKGEKKLKENTNDPDTKRDKKRIGRGQT